MKLALHYKLICSSHIYSITNTITNLALVVCMNMY